MLLFHQKETLTNGCCENLHEKLFKTKPHLKLKNPFPTFKYHKIERYLKYSLRHSTALS